MHFLKLGMNSKEEITLKTYITDNVEAMSVDKVFLLYFDLFVTLLGNCNISMNQKILAINKTK
jgi:hypothetical protein